ncbi:energy-coupling factor transporter transmembrane component T [Vagococcus sp.]|uniref:energy-coupling factor transporter transmembrane component T n=1 Tax=Vagococcus sp. TaxID=1933889 RepID=UPI003F9B2AD5
MKINYLFDPRSKLAVVITASLLLMFRFDSKVITAFILFIVILLLIEGGAKRAGILLAYYLTLSLLSLTFLNQPTRFITALTSFFIVGNLLVTPTIGAVLFCTHQTRVSEWLVALKKWHFPDIILIPLMVVCRFFPKLMVDIREIYASLRLRGIVQTKGDFLKTPFKLFEYLLIPVLMSVERISFDLSAVGYIRGLGSSKRNTTTIYQLKFGLLDYLVIVILFSGIVWGGVQK